METPLVSFRLRKEVDADIISAISRMSKKEINELSRDGLRLMLGFKSTRSNTIVERPLIRRPAYRDDAESRLVPCKPAVYIPHRRG